MSPSQQPKRKVFHENYKWFKKQYKVLCTYESRRIRTDKITSVPRQVPGAAT